MSTKVTATSASASEQEAQAIAVEAYVYLYPLLSMEVTRRQMTYIPAGTTPGCGPIGAFSHFRQYPAADWKTVVRANFDTLGPDAAFLRQDLGARRLRGNPVLTSVRSASSAVCAAMPSFPGEGSV